MIKTEHGHFRSYSSIRQLGTVVFHVPGVGVGGLKLHTSHDISAAPVNNSNYAIIMAHTTRIASSRGRKEPNAHYRKKTPRLLVAKPGFVTLAERTMASRAPKNAPSHTVQSPILMHSCGMTCAKEVARNTERRTAHAAGRTGWAWVSQAGGGSTFPRIVRHLTRNYCCTVFERGSRGIDLVVSQGT